MTPNDNPRSRVSPQMMVQAAFHGARASDFCIRCGGWFVYQIRNKVTEVLRCAEDFALCVACRSSVYPEPEPSTDKTIIRVRKTWNQWYAYFLLNPECEESASTLEEALGKLIMKYPGLFGIRVEQAQYKAWHVQLERITP